MASDLGSSESCLRRWMDLADVEDDRKHGLNSDERAGVIWLRREKDFGDGGRDH